ncbi:hypothetical protein [Paractinoplanes lichenicola]|uniref:Uncharacterized protein n=1 Tax=Paractinoplanes lichenicola TaxID=2802976 RepID=A0ABS1W5Y0_9ACTN|nr:hypothetical protein [Actinoplanes lichenicola]MBL7262145.1 hypothetical protein [Actinoplanes lichenicola]
MPHLFTHHRLPGGGDLQIMEWLSPAPPTEAATFHAAIVSRSPSVAALNDIFRRIHAQAIHDLPWCGPLDTNPANVMLAGICREQCVGTLFSMRNSCVLRRS